jgi:hypothetical protein
LKKKSIFILLQQDLHQLSINTETNVIYVQVKQKISHVKKVRNSNQSMTFLSGFVCVPQIILQSPLSGMQLVILVSACWNWILLITVFIWANAGSIQQFDEHCFQKWSSDIKRTIGQCTFSVTRIFLISLIYALVTL